MSVIGRSLRWLFNPRLLRTLLWIFLIVMAAIGVNLAGIHIVGNVNDWSRWLKNHGLFFLAWRLCLYGATVYGWWWMRKRILQREPSPETRARLLRAEISAVLTVAALETAALLRS